MQRLPLRAAGDHRPRCAGIHLRRRRREAQAGKAAGAGAVTCSSCKPMTDAVAMYCGFGVGDIDARAGAMLQLADATSRSCRVRIFDLIVVLINTF